MSAHSYGRLGKTKGNLNKNKTMIVIEYTHKELKGKRTGLGTQDFIITLTSNHYPKNYSAR